MLGREITKQNDADLVYQNSTYHLLGVEHGFPEENNQGLH